MLKLVRDDAAPAGASSGASRFIRIGPAGTAFGGDADLVAALERWLPGVELGEGRPRSLRFELALREPPAEPPGVPAFVHGQLGVWRAADRLTIRLGDRAGGVIDLSQGRGEVWATPGDRASPWLAVYGCLRPLWFLALGRAGLYQVHAACVEIEGSAILVAGDSGAGKSTLAARFVLLGARLVADDTTFLQAGDRLFVHGLGDAPRLAPEARRVMGYGLGRSSTGGGDVGRDDPDGKAPLWAPAGPSPSSEPRLIVFPLPGRAGRAEAQPLGPADAMVRLLRSGLITLDPASDGARLRALARLGEACPAYLLPRGGREVTLGVLRGLMAKARGHPQRRSG